MDIDISFLLKKYNMAPHAENGQFAECNYPFIGEGRAPSGGCYFFSGPGENTAFHQIDCDEYWCFNGGSPLEIWTVFPDGKLEISEFGLGKNAEPMVYFPKGVIFASRNRRPEGSGTFFTCITIPRFDYRGFRLVEKEEVTALCPEAAGFWLET